MSKKIDWEKDNSKQLVKSKGHDYVALDELPPTAKQLKRSKKLKASGKIFSPLDRKIREERNGINLSRKKIKKAKSDFNLHLIKEHEYQKITGDEKIRIQIRVNKIKNLEKQKTTKAKQCV